MTGRHRLVRCSLHGSPCPATVPVTRRRSRVCRARTRSAVCRRRTRWPSYRQTSPRSGRATRFVATRWGRSCRRRHGRGHDRRHEEAPPDACARRGDGGAHSRGRGGVGAGRHGQGRGQARPDHRRTRHREVRRPVRGLGGAMSPERTAVVITCSSRAAAGVYPDRSGPIIVEALRGWGLAVGEVIVVPDGPEVEEALREAVSTGAALVVTTGGTGLTPTDGTPEATRRVVDRRGPGHPRAL